MSWKPWYGVLLFLTTTVTYLSSIYIQKFPQRKKLFLLGFLLLNLGVLFVFKYFNLLSYSVNSVLHILKFQFNLPQFTLLLPIGISFYTFQTISYVVDIYKGKQQPEKNLGLFALYVSFFPQIVAGPIHRASQLIPQLQQKHSFEYVQVSSGIKLFAFGLFKKVVIADNLGQIVDRVFGSLHEYKGLSLILTVFLFSWQIYADFSGYTDMARGIARMLGFTFAENFHTPYFAISVGDFWRRWHITLSSWFRDYLYIPLGGNRHGIVRTCINTLIVFSICGLWHGAAWHFALWGLFHGIFLSVERIFQSRKYLKFFPQWVSILSTFTIITSSWVLFRAKSIEDAVYIFRYSLSGIKYFISLNYIWATLNQVFKENSVEMYIVLFCVGTIIAIEIISYKTSLSQLINNRPVFIRWPIYITVASLIVLLRDAHIAEFIYQQF